MKKAYYRKIPAYFNVETGELRGRNMLYSFLININLWFDVQILGVEEFPILVEKDDEEN